MTPKDTVSTIWMGAFPIMAMTPSKVRTAPSPWSRSWSKASPWSARRRCGYRDELVTHLACLPAVPGVLERPAGRLRPDQIAEITGRARRVSCARPTGCGAAQRLAARAETDAFMSGKKRVLV